MRPSRPCSLVSPAGYFSICPGWEPAPFCRGRIERPRQPRCLHVGYYPVDTIIICTIPGLVILSGTSWQYETGAHLTVLAFEAGVGTFGKLVVIISLIVFALTTIAGFAHISERCFMYLVGKNSIYYRLVFLVVTSMRSFLNLATVWSLSDIIIGLTIFSPDPIALRHATEQQRNVQRPVRLCRGNGRGANPAEISKETGAIQQV